MFIYYFQRGPPPMMPPPGMPPNFAMPPPGFPPPGMGPPGTQNSNTDQELWVENKTAEGKVEVL